MRTTSKTKTKRVAKETGDRISRIAGRVLRIAGQRSKEVGFDVADGDCRVNWDDGVFWRDVKALAASALGQDETKGLRVKGRKSKAKKR